MGSPNQGTRVWGVCSIVRGPLFPVQGHDASHFDTMRHMGIAFVDRTGIQACR